MPKYDFIIVLENLSMKKNYKYKRKKYDEDEEKRSGESEKGVKLI